MFQYTEPKWRPLEALIGAEGAASYMWMHEIEVDNGCRLQAYKHHVTRGYLHLDELGNRWIFRNGRYRRVTARRVR